MDLSQDYINVGKILILRAMRDMQKNKINLNELEYDEKIEEVCRNFVYTELFSRTDLLEIKNSLEMNNYSEKTMEELK